MPASTNRRMSAIATSRAYGAPWRSASCQLPLAIRETANPGARVVVSIRSVRSEHVVECATPDGTLFSPPWPTEGEARCRQEGEARCRQEGEARCRPEGEARCRPD